jgi:hypothetical protein
MDNELVQLGQKIYDLIQKKVILEVQVDKLTEELNIEQAKMIDTMESLQVKNIRLDDIGMFYLASSIYPKVLDQQLLFDDLRSRGDGSLIKETINSNTLRAYIKECMDNKNEVPKGIEIYAETKLRLKK